MPLRVMQVENSFQNNSSKVAEDIHAIFNDVRGRLERSVTNGCQFKLVLKIGFIQAVRSMATSVIQVEN
jgi:hypothetical protein